MNRIYKLFAVLAVLTFSATAWALPPGHQAGTTFACMEKAWYDLCMDCCRQEMWKCIDSGLNDAPFYFCANWTNDCQAGCPGLP